MCNSFGDTETFPKCSIRHFAITTATIMHQIAMKAIWKSDSTHTHTNTEETISCNAKPKMEYWKKRAAMFCVCLFYVYTFYFHWQKRKLSYYSWISFLVLFMKWG